MQPPSVHDALVKTAFSQVEHAEGFLRLVLPAALVARIDSSTLALRPGSFVDEALKERHSDLLYSVAISGRSALIYVLFEHKSKPEDQLDSGPARTGWSMRSRTGGLRRHTSAPRAPRSAPLSTSRPSRLRFMRLTQPELRALVGSVLRSDADFDAFCSDYFPEVRNRLSDGMDRTRKTTILLEQADHERLTELLLPRKSNARASEPGDGRVRVLFLAANPRETDALRLGREARAIEEKIRAAKHRDAIEFVSRWAVQPGDLHQALLEVAPHILHFSGHGTEREELVLEDDRGHAVSVDKAPLAELIGILNDNLRVVVLNACYSEPQAEALVAHVDSAIGMHRSIGDDAAVEFAASFYRAIGFGRSVDDAFRLGCNALRISGISEAQTPRLKVREGSDARRIILVTPS